MKLSHPFVNIHLHRHEAFKTKRSLLLKYKLEESYMNLLF